MSHRTRRAVSGMLLAALPFALAPTIGRAASNVPAGAVVQSASLIGGSDGDRVEAVAVDATGALILVGVTSSYAFPTKAALQNGLAGGTDAFVARVSADGRTVHWATFLGGSGDDRALTVVTTPSGEIWVGGSTTSTDFPMNGPIQGDNSGDETGFVARISADGSVLEYSTYLGGTGYDRVSALALDGSGSLWVAGSTDSSDLPVSYDAVMYYPAGGRDGFVARLSSDGLSLQYASYFGGTGDDEILAAAWDGSSALLLAGRTFSEDLPLVNALQETNAGGTDGFLAGIDGGNGSLRFATYLGGEGEDEVRSLSCRGLGVFAAAGTTSSPDFPTTPGLQDGISGGTDAFVAVLSADGSSLQFCSPLGGEGDDEGAAVSIAKNGSLILVGSTTSADFPLLAAGQPSPAGGTDGFIACIGGSWTNLTYASFIGGSGEDAILALAVDASGEPVVGGVTTSDDFPVLLGFQGVRAGGEEGFLARPLTAPAAPTGFQALAVSHRAASLAWSDPTGGRATFELDRRAGNGSWFPLELSSPDALDHVDADILPKTGYSYRIRLEVEGVTSPWSATVSIVTPQEPVPAAPGTPVVELLPDGSVEVRWNDLSDNEIAFEVFRSTDDGPFLFLRTATAGASSTIDTAIAPDRDYAWRVRSVGISGPSAFSAPAALGVPGNLNVELQKGRRKDAARIGKDSAILQAVLSPADGTPALDPVKDGLRISLGSGAVAPLCTVAPGADGWKERKGKWTWKSPRGSTSKFVIVVDGATGMLTVKGTRLELPGEAAGTLRLSIRCGGVAGSSMSEWTGKKAGLLMFD